MQYSNQRTYFADSAAAAAMRHEGIGWDYHDRSLIMPRPVRRSWIARIILNKRNTKMSHLEHVNITVSNPKATARMLEQLFDWRIRWEGAAMGGAGYTLHVGTEDSYIAIYSGSDPAQTVPKSDASYHTRGAMNHIGIVVDDLDLIAEKVSAMGYVAHSHADYEPGQRFYFNDDDGVEYEVISYA
ncbi:MULTISPECIES: VOC family protein [Rhodobacterales]|uniref:VOC family protein n=1 Tax=Rhodobacterales TaxID=204455 RepID=UPI0026D3C11F|nr:VOC family protein [Loktanella sp. D2R18]